MRDIHIEIPAEIMLSLRIPQERMESQLQEELALHLYREGFLSLGKARTLAHLTSWEFAKKLGERGIPRHYTQNDFEEDQLFANGKISW